MLRQPVAALALTLLLAGCQGGPGDPGAEPGQQQTTANEPTEPTASADPPGPADRLELVTGWGPTEAELDRAVRDARRLTLPELAGQVIVASWDGTAPPVDLVRGLHLGGVIAFSENVVSAGQVRDVNRTLTRRTDRPWPLFLGVDQEGGIVERIEDGVARFPAFMSAGAAADAQLTRRAYAASGAQLRGLGFTVDFAPDADVTNGPTDPTIGSRSAGSDPGLVAEQAVAAARGFAAGGVVPVLKHFPGHGSVPADSHLTLPVQRKSLAELRRSDLVPFREAVDAGLPAVMVGHLDIRAVDPRTPASLSHAVVTGLLRRDLGFGGLVVSDSLQMAAVVRGRDPGTIAVQALRAGDDVLLMPASPAAARAGIVRAVRTGQLDRSRLLQAVARQVALLRHERAAAPRTTIAPARAQAASRALSAAAITVAAGPCHGRLVEDAVVPSGDPEAVAAFGVAARAAGLEVLVRRTPPDRLTTARTRPDRRTQERSRHFRHRLREWRHDEGHRRAALAEWVAAEEDRLAAGTSIGFAGYGDAAVPGEIAVTTDTPYPLGAVDAPIRIATYGDTPGAMSALVAVLVGKAGAPGRLPVDVPGVERRGCRG